jgi:hypothetical protein
MHPQVVLRRALEPSVFVHAAIVAANEAGSKGIRRRFAPTLRISAVDAAEALLISS